MKTTLLLALTLVTIVATAQTQLSYYYNAAQTNRSEFSYNITVKIQKNAGETDAKRYTAILVQAMPDAKGFYNPSDSKLYNCSQLGNICNPNNFNLISVQIGYYCNGEKKIASATFRSLNEQRYLAVVLGAGGKFCESFDFVELKVIGAGLTPTHLGQIKDRISQLGDTKSALGGSANPMSTTTTATQNSPNSTANPVVKPSTPTTGIPASTSGNDPLAHFETDGKVKTNPMTNISSGSSRVDNINRSYQQGQQIADATMPILQGWVDARNARIDREIAKEKSDKDLYYHNYSKYDKQVEDITNYIYSNYDKYLIQNIPYFFNTTPKNWDNLLGSDFNIMFGKSFLELKTMKSFRRAFSNYLKKPEDCRNYSFSVDSNTVATFNANTPFWNFDMGYELNGRKIKYQQYSPIFNEDDVLIGVKLIPRNSYGQGTAVDYQSDIEGYIKDMKQDLGDNFIMLNGNTYLYQDKLIIFEYKRIIMLDANALKNQLVIKFKDAYYNQKETISSSAVSFGNFGFGCARSQSYQIVVKKEARDVQRLTAENPPMGLFKKSSSEKIEAPEQMGVLLITGITVNGVADKKGLKQGDVILSVNGYKINYIYQLQLALRTNLSAGKYSITYLRGNVEYTTELTSNSK